MTGRAEAFDRAAHAFCTVALVVVLARAYALPVAAGLAALFYFLAAWHRRRETGCPVRTPMVMGLLWALTSAASLWLRLRAHTAWSAYP